MNSLNRGMGLNHLYPFTLSDPAIEKLQFVHELTHATGARTNRLQSETMRQNAMA